MPKGNRRRKFRLRNGILCFCLGVMVTFCIIHLFTFLIRMWSVEFDAIIGYRYCGDNNNKDKSEKILKRGTHVLITPPPNKGNKTKFLLCIFG